MRALLFCAHFSIVPFSWNLPGNLLYTLNMDSTDHADAVPTVDTYFDLCDAKNSAAVILQAIAIQARDEKMAAPLLDMQPVTGGATNSLFKCTLGFSETSSSGTRFPVLVRVFGGEGSIDRVQDNAVFISLSKSGLGPKCHGLFANGRVEEFLQEFRSLLYEELSDERISHAIAAELARVHHFQPPSAVLGPRPEPSLWRQLWGWHKDALQVSFEAGTSQAALLEALHLDQAECELRELQAQVQDTWPLAFCNNDLNAENIMVNSDSGKIFLIDFEYGGINYIAFEIANHFNEYAGVKPEPDFTRFPSESHMLKFCEVYISQSKALARPDKLQTSFGGNDSSISTRDDRGRCHAVLPDLNDKCAGADAVDAATNRVVDNCGKGIHIHGHGDVSDGFLNSHAHEPGHLDHKQLHPDHGDMNHTHQNAATVVATATCSSGIGTCDNQETSMNIKSGITAEALMEQVTCVCVCVLCVCVHICIYTHIYMHMHMHMYMYACMHHAHTRARAHP